jgi:DNA repair protein RadC
MATLKVLRTRASASVVAEPEALSDHDLLTRLADCTGFDLPVTALLKRFQSVGHVLSAEPYQLHAMGLAEDAAGFLALAREIGRRLVQGDVRERPLLTNWQQLLDYLRASHAYEQTECFRVLYLDRKNFLIADEVQQRGTVDHVPVYPREVIKRALVLNASAVILVHNHPSGDPKPSRDDIDMTREIKGACDAVGVALHDHLVIGEKGNASFRSLGLL